MGDWWLVLLPLAVLLGWWLGHSRTAGRLVSQRLNQGQSNGYAQGLNYLLNDQPDRAIDLLVSMVEIDSETVETHLALGTLFRHQGEVERSIRIHQNLIARPTLTKNERAQAVLSLGLDFKQAGINDRAVNQFHKVASESPDLRNAALENLLEIHQYEKDWQQAIDVALKLVEQPNNYGVMICHFYCELVELAMADNDVRRAAKLLKQASAFGATSPRFSLMQIRLAIVKQKNRVALRWLEQLITHFPTYRLLALDDLEACYFASLDMDQFLDKLNELARDPQSNALLVCAIADRVERLAGRAQAAMLLVEQKNRFSSVLLNMKVIALSGADDVEGWDSRDSNVGVVDELMTQLIKNSTEYRCQQCGFSAEKLHWGCPGCGEWQSLQFQENN